MRTDLLAIFVASLLGITLTGQVRAEPPAAPQTEAAIEQRPVEEIGTPPPIVQPLAHGTIAVLGDSLADGIWGGIFRRLYRDKRYRIYRGAKNSVGFGGSDLLDMVDLAFSSGKVDAVIMMIGANDRRGVYGANGAIEAAYRSPQWGDAYRHRVERFMDAVTSKSVPLIWILLPVMRESDASIDAKQISAIVRAAAESRPLVSTIETWPITIDANGGYSDYLKDAKGQSRLFRAPDGVHFTEVGYETIGDAALAKLYEVDEPLRLMAQQK